MKKKILIGVGLYLVAGVVTAIVLAKPYPALSSKLEAVALWPGWIFNRLREGGARGAQSPVGTSVPLPPPNFDQIKGGLVFEGVREPDRRA